jgi:RimJ/RimL family protein N-acetyltransferase
MSGVAGPSLIESQGERKLLGGTGLALEAPTVASTGHVLARHAWARGYATEALAAVVGWRAALEFARIHRVSEPAFRAA